MFLLVDKDGYHERQEELTLKLMQQLVGSSQVKSFIDIAYRQFSDSALVIICDDIGASKYKPILRVKNHFIYGDCIIARTKNENIIGLRQRDKEIVMKESIHLIHLT